MARHYNNKNNKYKKKSQEIDFIVREECELMEFLMKAMDGISRTKVKKMLTYDLVNVNDRAVSQHDFLLKPNMRVTIKKSSEGNRFKNFWVKIVFEDDHILVIEKKPGILSSSTSPKDESVKSILNYYLDKSHQHANAHTVHRLDKFTSGLMIFAKSKKVALEFEEDWKERVYDRRYVALVHGELPKSQGTIASWLKDDSHYVTHSSQEDNGGKYAVSHYKKIKSGNGYSLVEMQLETGRKNQIRVHLQDLGCPVVGDSKYGDGSDPIHRLGLHAYKLCFKHPVTGEDMKFETDIPKAFYAAVGV
ncbi:MAG: RluA family pseudouridine synthase [Lentimicrobiaceae bacterium]|nr:RluA family pseudouridine synthase [Lentimicrobiaceae bacterium]